jgi:hypothetical protein
MSPIVRERAVAGKQEKLLGHVRDLVRLKCDSLRTELALKRREHGAPNA